MLNYLKTKDSNERTTPCSNKTEKSNSQLLPDSLPENLANADCFEERNESEVPVFDLSRMQKTKKNLAAAVKNPAIYQWRLVNRAFWAMPPQEKLKKMKKY